MKEMNRGNFLKISLLGLSGLFLGCQKPDLRYIYSPQMSPYLQDSLPNPIYRAGAIIASGNGAIGQMSLMENSGNLYLYTVLHVALALGNEFNFFVPGVNNFLLTTNTFFVNSRKIEVDDPCTMYALNLKSNHPLMNAVKKGIVAGLQVSNRLAEVGEEVALPNPYIGGFTYYQVRMYDSKSHLYLLSNDNRDIVCQGQSGTPILKMENGNVVPTILGVLSAISKKDLIKDPLKRSLDCSNILLARASV